MNNIHSNSGKPKSRLGNSIETTKTYIKDRSKLTKDASIRSSNSRTRETSQQRQSTLKLNVEQLLLACKQGDLKAVKTILDQQASTKSKAFILIQKDREG